MPQVNLSAFLDSSVLQLRDSIPQQVVVGLFQSLVCRNASALCPEQLPNDLQNLRHILFSSGGKLTGMVTKRDVVSLLTDDFPYAGALSGMPGNDWETPVR
jgi:chloride channel 3/4/5